MEIQSIYCTDKTVITSQFLFRYVPFTVHVRIVFRHIKAGFVCPLLT